jgi:hypothetical protein
MKKLALLTILFLFVLQIPIVYGQTRITVNCGTDSNGNLFTYDASGNKIACPNSTASQTTGSAPATVPATTQTQTGTNLGYTPLEPIPGITSGSFDVTNPSNLPQIISLVFKILITIGALFAVLNLTIGGIQYMTAEAVGNKTGGIKRAQNALKAILLITMSWLILNTINPNLLRFTFAPPCVTSSNGSGCVVTATPNDPFATGSINTTQPTPLPPDIAQEIQNSKTAPLTATDCSDTRTVLDPSNQGSCFSLSGIKNLLQQGISCSQYQSQLQQEQAALQQYVNRCAASGL